LFDGTFPTWFPFGYAGEPYLFFRPVFNFADAAISVGVAFLILFQRSYFNEEQQQPSETIAATEEEIKEQPMI
jgi:signal peptidase II